MQKCCCEKLVSCKMTSCKSVYSCKRVTVQMFSLVQKWPWAQKTRRTKLSHHAKMTLVKKSRRAKVSPACKSDACAKVSLVQKWPVPFNRYFKVCLKSKLIRTFNNNWFGNLLYSSTLNFNQLFVALQMSTSKSINKFELASTLEIGFKINNEQKLHDR